MPRVLFAADKFRTSHRSAKEHYPGGAELTDSVAISTCPWPLTFKTFRELSVSELSSFDVIIVGNSQTASTQLLNSLAETRRHVLFEHDLRICRWRGNFLAARDPLHRWQQRCWCRHESQRKLFDHARGVIFLTSLQASYYNANPYFACGPTAILGHSLFDRALLERAPVENGSRAGTCILSSPNVIKGTRAALEYCRARHGEPVGIRGLTPDDVLRVFSRSERFVYLPLGPEWAGRMVVEARLLGCEVVSNGLVGVTREAFWSAGRDQALATLLAGPQRFWQLVEDFMGAHQRQVDPRSASRLVQVEGVLRQVQALFHRKSESLLNVPRIVSAWS
jgi:hypothetical protein